MSALVWLGGVVLTILSFLFGKAFSQSERVLDQKRKTYEQFLSLCPAPNEAHNPDLDIPEEFQRNIGILSVYSAPDVAKLAGVYLSEFAEAQEHLPGEAEPGHPIFLELMTHYNRMVWAMRVDALAWSFFASSKSAKNYDTPLSRQFPRS